MKKQLLNISLFAVAIMLFANTAFSQPQAPVKVADLPAITDAINIDGLNDEASWSEAQESTIFSRSAEEDWEGPSDFTITFHFCWDYTYMYLFVNMVDDIEHVWDGTNGNNYEFDNIEPFWQLDTNTVTTAYNESTAQWRFNRGEIQWGSTEGNMRNDLTAEDIVTYWENTADGWLLEAAIPWMALMPAASLPEDVMDYIDGMIGFDLNGADSDGDDPLVGARGSGTQTAWDEDGVEGDEADGTEDLAWNNTSVFGYLHLVGDPISSTNEVAAEGSFNVYPNPVTNTINISGVNGPVEIYNIAGVHVMTIETNSADVSTLTSGVYIAVFDNQSVKFIK